MAIIVYVLLEVGIMPFLNVKIIGLEHVCAILEKL